MGNPLNLYVESTGPIDVQILDHVLVDNLGFNKIASQGTNSAEYHSERLTVYLRSGADWISMPNNESSCEIAWLLQSKCNEDLYILDQALTHHFRVSDFPSANHVKAAFGWEPFRTQYPGPYVNAGFEHLPENKNSTESS